MVQDKPLRTSWQRKMKERQERKLVKDFARHLEEEKERRRQVRAQLAWRSLELKSWASVCCKRPGGRGKLAQVPGDGWLGLSKAGGRQGCREPGHTQKHSLGPQGWQGQWSIRFSPGVYARLKGGEEAPVAHW